jgi:hypothetical protein
VIKKLDQSKLGQQKTSVMYVCLMQGASFGQVRQTWQTGSACPEQFKVIFLVGEERACIKPLRNLFILGPLQVIYIMAFEVADEWYRL